MSFFNRAKDFLLIRPYELNKEEMEMVEDFMFELKNEKKEVFVLVWHKTKKLPPDLIPGAFEIHGCRSDFNILGNPSSYKLKKQLVKKYDYLINTFDHPVSKIEKMVAKSMAKIKIARYESDKKKDLYGIVLNNHLHSDNTLESFLTSLGTYITKIEVYESN